MAKKLRNNISEIVHKLGPAVTKIRRRDIVNSNKRISEKLDDLKRELYQKEKDSKVSASKITLR
jgi:hypothetical protein